MELQHFQEFPSDFSDCSNSSQKGNLPCELGFVKLKLGIYVTLLRIVNLFRNVCSMVLLVDPVCWIFLEFWEDRSSYLYVVTMLIKILYSTLGYNYLYINHLFQFFLKFAGLFDPMLCACCLCVWGLSSYNLERWGLPHDICMFWSYNLAPFYPSLSRGNDLSWCLK